MNVYNYKSKTILMQKDKQAAVSIGISTGNKIFLGSWGDEGILVCYLN